MGRNGGVPCRGGSCALCCSRNDSAEDCGGMFFNDVLAVSSVSLMCSGWRAVGGLLCVVNVVFLLINYRRRSRILSGTNANCLRVRRLAATATRMIGIHAIDRKLGIRVHSTKNGILRAFTRKTARKLHAIYLSTKGCALMTCSDGCGAACSSDRPNTNGCCGRRDFDVTSKVIAHIGIRIPVAGVNIEFALPSSFAA